jgi:hypothetical protein
MSNEMASSTQWYDPTGGKGSVTARYGQAPKNKGQWTGKGVHTGVDYGVASNSAAYAISGGKIVSAGYDPKVGNYVGLEVAPGKVVNYAHLNKVNVKVGQQVKGGSALGLTGNTGSGSRGAHLHTEYVVNGDFVSPELFYGKNAPAYAKSTYVPGAKQSLGRAWSYKGSPAVEYKGGVGSPKASSNAVQAASTPANLGARLTSSVSSPNAVGRIY